MAAIWKHKESGKLVCWLESCKVDGTVSERFIRFLFLNDIYGEIRVRSESEFYEHYEHCDLTPKQED